MLSASPSSQSLPSLWAVSDRLIDPRHRLTQVARAQGGHGEQPERGRLVRVTGGPAQLQALAGAPVHGRVILLLEGQVTAEHQGRPAHLGRHAGPR